MVLRVRGGYNMMREYGLSLLQMQNIIAVLIVGAYVYLAYTGKIDADSINNVTLMVVGFLFGNQAKKGE